MDQIQDLLVQWWASADSSTQMAVIAFGTFMLAISAFSIIGTYTNPSRRPPNEIDFRRFQQATTPAAEARLMSAAQDEPEPEPETKQPSRRSFRWGRLY